MIGGQCAQHPEAQSNFTCARCGGFMCDVCAVGGSETLCPACRQRTGVGAFPYHRGDFSFDRLFSFTFEAWKKQWVMLSVAVLALGGIYMAGALVIQLVLGVGGAALGGGGQRPQLGAGFAVIGVIVFLGYLLLLTVLGVGFIGLLRMCTDALLGKAVDFGVLFSQFSKLGRAIGLMLMMAGIAMIPMAIFGAIVGVVAAVAIPAAIQGGEGGGRELLAGGMFAVAMVGYVLLIIVIIWITLPFTLAMLELAHTDAGAVECLKRGYKLSKGFMLQLLGYRILGGLIASVGMLACCIGMLPAIALAYMLESALYLAIRNGSGLPPLDNG